MIALAVALVTPAQAFETTWLGGEGNWLDDTRWSYQVLPDYMTDVRIDGSELVPSLVNIANGRVGAQAANLTIGPWATLSTQRSVMAWNDVVSTGRIELIGSTGNTSTSVDLDVRQGKVRLAAGGSTVLSGRSDIRVGDSATGLTIESGHVLSGNGAVTARKLLNQGLIEAQGGTLTVGSFSSSSLAMTNEGMLRAATGAQLQLAGYVENSGQGRVELNDSTLSVNGTLAGGTIVANGSQNMISGSMYNVTFQGRAQSTGLLLMGTFTNDGVIDLVSYGTGTYAPDFGDWYHELVTIEGRGDINATGPLGANLHNVTLGAGQTFRGSAVVNGSFVNHGRVILQGSAGLSAGYQAQTFMNRGVIEVSAGSQLNPTTGLDNEGGNVYFAAGSTLGGMSATQSVRGGVLHAAGGLLVQGPATFADLALNGSWQLGSDATLHVKGTIQINHGLTLGESGGRGANLVLAGDTHLTGAGETVLTGSSYIQNDWSNYSQSLLTIDAGHTVRGNGFISAALLNKGLIQVDAGGRIQISSSSPWFNRGTLRTLGGGTLHLAGGTLDNEGGLIDLGDGGQLFDYSGKISGGVLRGGTQTDAVILANELNNITLTGRIKGSNNTLWNGGTVSLSGTVTNQGVLTVGGEAGGLLVRTEANLAGRGRTVLQGADGYLAIRGEQGSTGTLTIAADHTVVGHGQTVFLDVINKGSLSAEGGDLRMLYAQQLVNEGVLHVTQGSKLETDGRVIQQGSESRLVIDGRLKTPGLDMKAGTLQGPGVLEGDLRVEGGSVNLSTITGALAVTGNYWAGEGSTLAIDLSSSTDALVSLTVGGNASLDGLLVLDFGAFAQFGDSFTLLSSSGLLTGVFSDVTVRGTDLQVTLSYLDNRVTASLAQAVPELSTWWMTLIGLGAVAGVVRGRQRASV